MFFFSFKQFVYEIIIKNNIFVFKINKHFVTENLVINLNVQDQYVWVDDEFERVAQLYIPFLPKSMFFCFFFSILFLWFWRQLTSDLNTLLITFFLMIGTILSVKLARNSIEIVNPFSDYCCSKQIHLRIFSKHTDRPQLNVYGQAAIKPLLNVLWSIRIFVHLWKVEFFCEKWRIILRFPLFWSLGMTDITAKSYMWFAYGNLDWALNKRKIGSLEKSE